MIRSYHKEVYSIIYSTNMLSPTSIRFLGNQHYIDTNFIKHKTKFGMKGENNIVTYLGNILYRVVHCRKHNTQSESENFIDNTESKNFIYSLSQANKCSGSWESGWTIKKIYTDKKKLIVHKNGLSLWVTPKQFQSLNGCLNSGEKGYVRMPREFQRLFPGYYMIISGKPAMYKDENNITVRLYWNIKSTFVTLFVKDVTEQLKSAGIPFHFKILNDPYLYPRADAAVLYIKKIYLEKSINILLPIYQRLKKSFNHDTPLFAKRLSYGISLAEDPSNNKQNESFGKNRCRIFAEAICNIYMKNLQGQEKIAEVYDHFKRLGLDFDRPYLNPSSTDNYDKLFGEIKD